MSNTLIIGYGGFGCNCVRELSRLNHCPAILLDTHTYDLSDEEYFLNSIEIGHDGLLDEYRLRDLFSNYRRIFLISSLGGESFAHAYSAIFESARQLEIPLVSLCTLPYVFESDRRDRSMENLEALADSVCNMFIIDSQKTIMADRPAEDLLENVKKVVVQSAAVLANLMDCGPFQSFCSDRMYTVSFGSASDLSDAVGDAISHKFFEQDSVFGKILIASSVKPTKYDLENINSALMQYSGAFPDYVGTVDSEEWDVILLIPISFRRHG